MTAYDWKLIGIVTALCSSFGAMIWGSVTPEYYKEKAMLWNIIALILWVVLFFVEKL